jgi:hypothetical protein
VGRVRKRIRERPGSTGDATATAAGTPSRRTLLAGTAVGLLGLAACSPADTGTGPDGAADTETLTRARDTAAGLAATLTALGTANPGLADLPALLAQRHARQIAVLTPESPQTTATAATSAGTAADAVAAERAAAVQALGDLRGTTEDTTRLLTQIAADDAVHADLLASAAGLPAPAELTVPAAPGDASTQAPGASPAANSATSTTTGSGNDATDGEVTLTPTAIALARSSAAAPPATRGAIHRLLAGEHAAIYAYGVAVARVNPEQRDTARAGWQAHRQRRDALTEQVRQLGLTPAAALDAYDLGDLGEGSTAAVTLITRVEQRLATVALSAAGLTDGALRDLAARTVVDCARRQATWTRAPADLPDLPAES